MTTNPPTEHSHNIHDIDEALKNCEREAIQFANYIQPNGVLLALDDAGLIISHVSENINTCFPYSASELLGQPFSQLVGQKQADSIRLLIDVNNHRHTAICAFNILINEVPTSFDAQISLYNTMWIVEIEHKRNEEGDPFHTLFVPIQNALMQLDSESDLFRYSNQVVEQVRLLIGYDRVMMYKFDNNWDGEVIAENKNEEAAPYLGHRFPAGDIPPQARSVYTKNLLRLSADVDAQPVKVIPERHSHSGLPLDMTYSTFRSLSPIHIEYLHNMGVGASFSISLVHNNRLWGMIACHHSKAKYITLRNRLLIEFISKFTSRKIINIEENDIAHRREKTHLLLRKLTRNISLNRSSDFLLKNLDDDLLSLVCADGAFINLNGSLHHLGKTPTGQQAIDIDLWIKSFSEKGLFHFNNLTEINPALNDSQDVACGILVAPLERNFYSYIAWFRGTVINTIKWAGKPDKIIRQNQGKLTISPRSSFATWVETFQAQSAPWLKNEIAAAQSLSLSIVEVLGHEAMKQSKENFRLLAENSKAILHTLIDGVIQINQNGVIISVNNALCKMFGYEENELIGRNINILMTEPYRTEHNNYLSRSTHENSNFVLGKRRDLPGLHKDGTLLLLDIAVNELNANNEREFIGVLRDVGESRYLFKKLLNSSETNLALLRNASDGIHILNAEGNVIEASNSFCTMLGYSRNEVIGMNVSQWEAQLSNDELAQILEKQLAHHDRVLFESRHQRKDGTLFNVEISGQRLELSGELVIFNSSRGITTRKQAEAQTNTLIQNLEQALTSLEAMKVKAESANRAKSEFLANMSHEIRTPMNAILGMAEILSETELTVEQNRYVKIFQNAGNTLLELINEILDMSKVEAGQLELDKECFSLEQTLDELVDLHAIRAFDKGIELVLDIEFGVPEFVYGDGKRLKQCLTNLLGNAIKFSDKGVIIIYVQRVPDHSEYLQFSVQDNGIGIPIEKHETIFEAFSQADSSTTRRFGGTGLGLSITRRLVELMGGKIWIKSQPNKGSTFIFTALLPQVNSPAPQNDLPINLQNLKLLMVDDHAINRIIVWKYLQPLGMIVHEAESAQQALLLLEEAAQKGEPFTLALLDCQMPEMDGLDLSMLIRANPQLKDLKIMIYSSSDTPLQRQRAKNLALTFLLKPIKRHEMVQAISCELQSGAPIANLTITSSIESPSDQDGLHILLAEDNPDNVVLIEVYLKKTTHHLDIAENGLVALEKFKSNHYDLVLMDVQMPQMGGYEATAEIRNFERQENRSPTTIIALTAHALKEDEQRSIDAGCNSHITKPIKKKVLLEILKSMTPKTKAY